MTREILLSGRSSGSRVDELDLERTREYTRDGS